MLFALSLSTENFWKNFQTSLFIEKSNPKQSVNYLTFHPLSSRTFIVAVHLLILKIQIVTYCNFKCKTNF